MIGNALRVADAPDLPLLQDAQQFGLERLRHRVHFIEEDGAAFRFLEEADLVLHRAGEGALLVAEEFGFEQVLGQRRAVDGHEGLVLPRGIEMQRAGDEFLAGAALALDQDGAVGIGDLGDEVVDLLHLRARADDVLEAVFLLDDLPQVAVLADEALVIERALDGELQLIHLERLGDVVVGAELHRLERRLHRLVRRDQDDRRLRQHLAAFAEDVEAADLVHAQIGDDELRGVHGEVFQRLLSGSVGHRLMSTFLADVGDDRDHSRVVIDDENSSHKREVAEMRLLHV